MMFSLNSILFALRHTKMHCRKILHNAIMLLVIVGEIVILKYQQKCLHWLSEEMGKEREKGTISWYVKHPYTNDDSEKDYDGTEANETLQIIQETQNRVHFRIWVYYRANQEEGRKQIIAWRSGEEGENASRWFNAPESFQFQLFIDLPGEVWRTLLKNVLSPPYTFLTEKAKPGQEINF